VPVDQTLARVRGELAAGQTGRARQRLRGLIATFPERLEFRSMLAATYRDEGALDQAGRWSYLDPDADPAEQAAFLAAYPDPVQRVRKVRWKDGVPVEAAGPVGAARLTELRAAAETATGKPVSWQEPRARYQPGPEPVGERLLAGGCLTGLVLVLLLAIVGAVVVVRALFG
jgi:hypothetical protein